LFVIESFEDDGFFVKDVRRGRDFPYPVFPDKIAVFVGTHDHTVAKSDVCRVAVGYSAQYEFAFVGIYDLALEASGDFVPVAFLEKHLPAPFVKPVSALKPGLNMVKMAVVTSAISQSGGFRR
jgi:hypothetical protein